MSRGLICSLALFTTTISALADPKVDAAINVFKQTETAQKK
jgi:hypothetical protein